MYFINVFRIYLSGEVSVVSASSSFIQYLGSCHTFFTIGYTIAKASNAMEYLLTTSIRRKQFARAAKLHLPKLQFVRHFSPLRYCISALRLSFFPSFLPPPLPTPQISFPPLQEHLVDLWIWSSLLVPRYSCRCCG
jgi:hypothetical protein